VDAFGVPGVDTTYCTQFGCAKVTTTVLALLAQIEDVDNRRLRWSTLVADTLG
jgi:hypothetical protein